MDKILLIMGASSEVGLALIRRVAKNYNKVLAHYCHWNEQLENLKQDFGGKVVFFQADFLDPGNVQNMVSEIIEQNLQPDHIVHFPAPKMQIEKFLKTQWGDFENGWKISLHSFYSILQAMLPHMGKKNYGKVILMLTSGILDKATRFQTSYMTVKYALAGLMDNLAAEYEGRGITFNSVSPDMIRTKFLSGLPELMVEQYALRRPSGKILAVDDVLPVFEFLLSEGADHINGVNIKIQ